MSGIEVSLVAPSSEKRVNLETKILRPQRSPPPPPSQSSEASNQRLDEATKLQEPTVSLASMPTSSIQVDHATMHDKTFVSNFHSLFDEFDYETIRERILNREMTECDFTTVLWRIFLHCLPRDSRQWNEMLDTTRCNYEKLVLQYTIDPYRISDNHNDSRNVNHPLSRDENCLWGQFFANKELETTITTDVRRTFPDISLFRDAQMIDLQLRVLFTHSRHYNKTLPYRQGMHEILGTVVYALYFESKRINECRNSTALMKKLYDPQYLEHDSYAIFEKIIDHLRQFYTSTTRNPSVNKLVAPNGTKQIPFQRSHDTHVIKNDTILRMNSIFDRLKHYDQFLHGKLLELNIEPTVYGVRWLRLLFGREIPFDSVPNLWTIIFCFDEHIGFVDYFFVALLMQVAQIIRKQEDAEQFSYLAPLMQQNSITDAELVIRKALTLTGRQLQPLPEKTVALPIRNKYENQPNTAQSDREYGVPQKTIFNHLNTSETEKSTLTSSTDLLTHYNESSKRGSSNSASWASSSQTGAPYSTTAITRDESDQWNGRSIRQKFDENVRLQRSCGELMHKFLEQLQKQISDLETPSKNVLHMQIAGLKQIANVLEGKLKFDSHALQSLINYESKEKHTKANNTHTS